MLGDSNFAEWIHAYELHIALAALRFNAAMGRCYLFDEVADRLQPQGVGLARPGFWHQGRRCSSVNVERPDSTPRQPGLNSSTPLIRRSDTPATGSVGAPWVDLVVLHSSLQLDGGPPSDSSCADDWYTSNRREELHVVKLGFRLVVRHVDLAGLVGIPAEG